MIRNTNAIYRHTKVPQQKDSAAQNTPVIYDPLSPNISQTFFPSKKPTGSPIRKSPTVAPSRIPSTSAVSLSTPSPFDATILSTSRPTTKESFVPTAPPKLASGKPSHVIKTKSPIPIQTAAPTATSSSSTPTTVTYTHRTPSPTDRMASPFDATILSTSRPTAKESFVPTAPPKLASGKPSQVIKTKSPIPIKTAAPTAKYTTLTTSMAFPTKINRVETVKPTSSPNKSATTKRPTSTPTAQPSRKPSVTAQSDFTSHVSASPGPTIFPSRTSVKSPSSKPTGHSHSQTESTQYPVRSTAPSGCSVNAQGSFGSVSPFEIPIFYKYEAEILNGADIKQIIALIESSISDTLISSYFTRCMYTAPSSLRRNRQLHLVGISSKPIDIIDSEGGCTRAGSNECYIIAGRLNVFSDQDELVSTNAYINKMIETMFSNGSLVQVHASIIRLDYVQGTDKEPSEFDQSPANSLPSGEGHFSTPVYFVLAGVSVTIVVALFATARGFCRYYATTNEDESDLYREASVDSADIGIASVDIEGGQDPSSIELSFIGRSQESGQKFREDGLPR